jgi:hypothetical protein
MKLHILVWSILPGHKTSCEKPVSLFQGSWLRRLHSVGGLHRRVGDGRLLHLQETILWNRFGRNLRAKLKKANYKFRKKIIYDLVCRVTKYQNFAQNGRIFFLQFLDQILSLIKQFISDNFLAETDSQNRLQEVVPRHCGNRRTIHRRHLDNRKDFSPKKQQLSFNRRVLTLH